jgi:UDP-N-acetyl-2-amino-2-deoxyglucuronate dehydrogenase
VTIHIGFAGGGGITDTHVQAAGSVPGVEIAAVQGPNEQKVRAICSRHGGQPYASFDAFLAHRRMDIVAIGSPSGLHAVQGMAAARAGLHVLVEKPIDITTGRADALVAAARNAGVALGVFFQDRFKRDVGRLKQLLDEGGVGKPLLVDARVPWYRPPEYYATSRWRGTWALDGGGALMNQGIHTVDLLLWLLGDVGRVHARTATLLHNIEVEDSGAAILEFTSGALGVLSFTTAAYPGYARRVAVTGDRGTVVLEEDRLARLDVQGGGPRLSDVASPAERGDGTERSFSPLVSDASAHRAVIEDFIAAIRDSRPPRCDGREARRSVAVVEAIYQSSRMGQPVLVDRGRD